MLGSVTLFAALCWACSAPTARADVAAALSYEGDRLPSQADPAWAVSGDARITLGAGGIATIAAAPRSGTEWRLPSPVPMTDVRYTLEFRVKIKNAGLTTSQSGHSAFCILHNAQHVPSWSLSLGAVSPDNAGAGDLRFSRGKWAGVEDRLMDLPIDEFHTVRLAVTMHHLHGKVDFELWVDGDSVLSLKNQTVLAYPDYPEGILICGTADGLNAVKIDYIRFIDRHVDIAQAILAPGTLPLTEAEFHELVERLILDGAPGLNEKLPEHLLNDLQDLEKDVEHLIQRIGRLPHWPDKFILPVRNTVQAAIEKARRVGEQARQAGTNAQIKHLHDTLTECRERIQVLDERLQTWINIAIVPDASTSFLISQAGPLQRVFRDRQWSGRIAEQLHFEMAANEYENAQLVVIPLVERLSALGTTCAGLRNKDGHVIAADNLEIHPVGYVHLPPGDIKLPAGWYPDLILRKTTVDIGPSQTVQPLWIRVHTPAGTPRGDYQGTIEIAEQHGEAVQIPITVKVWGFEIPRQQNLPTDFSLSPYYQARFFFGEEAAKLPTKCLTADIYRKYLEMVLKYRINPKPQTGGRESLCLLGYLGEELGGPGLDPEGRFSTLADGWDGETIKLDFTEFDKNTQLMVDHGVPLIYIGYFASSYTWNERNQRAYFRYWTKYLEMMREHLREKGWENKAYIYAPDEPLPKHVGGLKQVMAFIKDVAPNVKRLEPYGYPQCQPPADQEGWLDIWVPFRNLRHGLYSKQFRQERARWGQSVWWYVVDDFAMDHSLYDVRELFWDLWQTEADGFLFWAINHYTWNPSFEDIEEDGTLKRSFLPAKHAGRMTRCSFHLIYPAGKRAEDGAVPSIRLEAIRDGIEDWEYLYQLRQLVTEFEQEETKSPLVEQARALLADVGEGRFEDLRSTRRAVAKLLERLSVDN